MTVHPQSSSGESKMKPTQDNPPDEPAKKTEENGEEVQPLDPEEKDLSVLVEKITIEEKQDDTEVTDDDFDKNGDPVFPHDELAKLDEMVNKPKWIIPVLPKAELEILMDATIKLAKKGWSI